MNHQASLLGTCSYSKIKLVAVGGCPWPSEEAFPLEDFLTPSPCTIHLTTPDFRLFLPPHLPFHVLPPLRIIWTIWFLCPLECTERGRIRVSPRSSKPQERCLQIKDLNDDQPFLTWVIKTNHTLAICFAKIIYLHLVLCSNGSLISVDFVPEGAALHKGTCSLNFSGFEWQTHLGVNMKGEISI